MKKRRKIIHTGFSLMMLIWVVLMLIIFAALSMMSAQSDYKLSEKLAERTKTYYRVSGQANEILGEVDEFLSDNYAEGIGKKEYYKRLSQFQYRDAAIPMQTDGDRMTWNLPLNKNHTLKIELKILYPDADDTVFYEITEWKTVQEGSWNKDESIPVLKKDDLTVFKDKNRKK